MVDGKVNLRRALAVHAEALDGPVAAGHGVLEALRDDRPIDVLDPVEVLRAACLL
jgi:hypothetical protein